MIAKTSNPKNIFQRIFSGKNKKVVKLTDNVNTVDDLLAKDDINSILQEIDSDKKDISDIIIIFQSHDGSMHYRSSSNNPIQIFGMMEYAKNMMCESED